MLALPEVKYMIAIASGKGGVGKSTTAVNLALALAQENVRVGLLDADIYGPSQPVMLGARELKPVADEATKQALPIERYGIQSMSIGYFIDVDTPMVWRGPMVSTALQQLIRDTRWQAVEYLIIDLPPGTGDIQLTLAQKIPLTGAVIVTTPQDIALIDARKAIAMFNKVHVPVLGIIENMSTYICSHCGHSEAIFGSGGAAHMAETLHIPLLGQLPLDKRIREHADNGKPTVIAEPDSAIAQQYRAIARQLIEKIAQQQRFKNKFPKIVIEDN